MSNKAAAVLAGLVLCTGALWCAENPFAEGGAVTLYFEVGSGALAESETEKLEAVGVYLEAEAPAEIIMEGSAAPFDREDQQYNMGLERAENVKKYLLEHFEIEAGRIEVRSTGSARSAGYVEGQDNEAYREDRTVRIYLKAAAASGGEAESEAGGEAEADGTWAEYRFALRANLLRWATLTPDIGAEWRINRDWGIAAGVTWTGWKIQDFRYALWEVAPEVRYYLGKEKRGYIGVMFKAGEFNYRFGGPGLQGLILGGGVSGGYQLPLTEKLALDFHAALGYLNASCEEYEVSGGTRVLKERESRHWIGPVHAGISLVWKLF